MPIHWCWTEARRTTVRTQACDRCLSRRSAACVARPAPTLRRSYGPCCLVVPAMLAAKAVSADRIGCGRPDSGAASDQQIRRRWWRGACAVSPANSMRARWVRPRLAPSPITLRAKEERFGGGACEHSEQSGASVGWMGLVGDKQNGAACERICSGRGRRAGRQPSPAA